MKKLRTEQLSMTKIPLLKNYETKNPDLSVTSFYYSFAHPGFTEDIDKTPNSFDALPYKEKFVFGYVTLIDPRLDIKKTVFQEIDGKKHQRLDEGEKVVLDYLIKGRHYGTTGN